MRRYHFCIGDDNDAQCGVETTAGRLSAKVKRFAEVRGRAVVRNTTASRSTDLDGVRERPEDFIARHGWRRINMMTKVQAKIPFALRSGTAYLASAQDLNAGGNAALAATGAGVHRKHRRTTWNRRHPG
jgi:hypothetical protein